MKRINEKTGQEEWWNQPKGLPGIWIPTGPCDRCLPFNKCLGLGALNKKEWSIVEDFMEETKDLLSAERKIEEKGLEKCGV
jgi:hypothetical protein